MSGEYSQFSEHDEALQPKVDFVAPPRQLSDEQILAYYEREAGLPDCTQGISEFTFLGFFPEDEIEQLRAALSAKQAEQVKEIIQSRIAKERSFALAKQSELANFLSGAFPDLVKHLGVKSRALQFAVWPEIEQYADRMVTGRNQGEHGGKYIRESGIYILTNTMRESTMPMVQAGEMQGEDYECFAIHEIIHALSDKGGENIGFASAEEKENMPNPLDALNEAMTEHLNVEFFTANYSDQTHQYTEDYLKDGVLLKAVGEIVGERQLREWYFMPDGKQNLLYALRSAYHGQNELTDEALENIMYHSGDFTVEQVKNLLCGNPVIKEFETANQPSSVTLDSLRELQEYFPHLQIVGVIDKI